MTQQATSDIQCLQRRLCVLQYMYAVWEEIHHVFWEEIRYGRVFAGELHAEMGRDGQDTNKICIHTSQQTRSKVKKYTTSSQSSPRKPAWSFSQLVIKNPAAVSNSHRPSSQLYHILRAPVPRPTLSALFRILATSGTHSGIPGTIRQPYAAMGLSRSRTG